MFSGLGAANSDAAGRAAEDRAAADRDQIIARRPGGPETIQSRTVPFHGFGAGGPSAFWRDLLSVLRAAKAARSGHRVFRCGEPVRVGIPDQMQHTAE